MYGKLFESMFDGTLADNWEALVVFQQMVILCDADGRIDMTPIAMHRRTGIPLEIIKRGIAILVAPDAQSRTSIEEGRRIKLLDVQREWGWEIVNHKYYRSIATRADKQQRDRERMRELRESQGVANSRVASRGVASVADVAHTDTDADADAKAKAKSPGASKRFDDFWSVVHQKIGKRAAERAFARAVVHLGSSAVIAGRDAAAEKIIEAMRLFALTPDSKPKDRTAIHPTTWLNQGRYLDEVESNDASDTKTGSKLNQYMRDTDGT